MKREGDGSKRTERERNYFSEEANKGMLFLFCLFFFLRNCGGP